jgi:hypothetical protein
MGFPNDLEIHQRDARFELVHHRHIHIEDTSPETLDMEADSLYAQPDPDTLDTPFDPKGSQNVELRIAHGAATTEALDDTTSTWTIVGIPYSDGSETPPTRKLLEFVATAGAYTSHKHPKTGEVDATLDYSEPDTFGSIKPWTRYKVLDGTDGGTGDQDVAGAIQFDPCGMKIMAICTAVSAGFAALTTPTVDAILLNVG